MPLNERLFCLVSIVFLMAMANAIASASNNSTVTATTEITESSHSSDESDIEIELTAVREVEEINSGRFAPYLLHSKNMGAIESE